MRLNKITSLVSVPMLLATVSCATTGSNEPTSAAPQQVHLSDTNIQAQPQAHPPTQQQPTSTEHIMADNNPTTSTPATPSVETKPVSWTVRSSDDTNLIKGSVVRLTVHGMSCPKCANNITRQVVRAVGVRDVNIDMASGFVYVDILPNAKPTPKELAQQVANTGFTLVEIAER